MRGAFTSKPGCGETPTARIRRAGRSRAHGAKINPPLGLRDGETAVVRTTAQTRPYTDPTSGWSKAKSISLSSKTS